ncbi:MAG: DNA gyrase subunit A, partial [Gemmatimonadetes bacterium]|nr:DNA gyrase subunit A [Gemmatimonadota bacterium]NIU77165.1 DNA gyrase subunit A [Gammaproteobacteria bacterium]NIP82412.1 DNA gyrase subunit A [Gemmatimonadota bacterium]NIQ56992.1 DNA gyrase subunit A [Gemmatimonadota bacterium]NIX47326.1 DNA gyrase subunit A [Gemmatimonadota bacterium]
PVLNKLYKKTYMQATFGAIMIALDHGVPREMTLKQMLEKYRDHRIEVIQRRAAYDLEQAKAEAHVTEGLITALDNIDEVIRIIRESKGKEEAAESLQEAFDLSRI